MVFKFSGAGWIYRIFSAPVKWSTFLEFNVRGDAGRFVRLFIKKSLFF